MTSDPYLTTVPGAMTTEPPAGTHALLARAVELGVASVGQGGGPFGAVVARLQDGVLVPVAEGANQVTTANDPTAHAEVVALRAAGAALGTFDLSGCVMLASCEPCPMCLTAGLWARVDSMWFAASREDAATAGFDDLAFYDAMAQPREHWSVPVRSVDLPERTAPFDEWSRTAGRVEY
ncbi:nucleoside deaminase [Aquipuribacter sp. MA13-6]|uniref:nucleoside deaminase n=1 Tax=unclassified Aquipuribacter TaxID=2635084 RepID=UPI003EEAE483